MCFLRIYSRDLIRANLSISDCGLCANTIATKFSQRKPSQKQSFGAINIVRIAEPNPEHILLQIHQRQQHCKENLVEFYV